MVDADAHLAAWDHDKKKTIKSIERLNEIILFNSREHIDPRGVHRFSLDRRKKEREKTDFSSQTNNCGSWAINDVKFFFKQHWLKIIILQTEYMYDVSNKKLAEVKSYVELYIYYVEIFVY